MTILVTLTAAGTSTTLFNLYSNLDYVTPLVTGITKAALLAGYSLNSVPDSATSIRVTATGVCTNSIDIPISGLTTTSTSSTSTSSTTSTTTLPTTSTSTSSTTSTTTLPTTTSSSTTTTTAPPTSTTTSSTTTSTSSTTTTTTTTTEPPLWLCVTYEATLSTGTGFVSWTDCNGSPGNYNFTAPETYTFCALENTPTGSQNVNITLIAADCAEECVEYTVSAENGGGTVDYTDCFGNPQSFTVAFGEVTAPFCALQGSVFASGFLLIGIIGTCEA
jgi:hypothetical protein